VDQLVTPLAMVQMPVKMQPLTLATINATHLRSANLSALSKDSKDNRNNLDVSVAVKNLLCQLLWF
jgi:hypothetical protein